MIGHYDFDEHKHRYAVWTAARAVQRSFTTTGHISTAIQATNLRTICQSTDAITSNDFDLQHRELTNALITSFADHSITCTYGRAAKIIAIYIKTSVVLPTAGKSSLAEVAHPPIDAILLQAISQMEGLQALQRKRWTQFSEDDYWETVALVRSSGLPFNWRLEAFWKPERDVAAEAL